jgi:hypothetical protein
MKNTLTTYQRRVLNTDDGFDSAEESTEAEFTYRLSAVALKLIGEIFRADLDTLTKLNCIARVQEIAQEGFEI